MATQVCLDGVAMATRWRTVGCTHEHDVPREADMRGGGVQASADLYTRPHLSMQAESTLHANECHVPEVGWACPSLNRSRSARWTGAKLRRCCGQGPCVCSAARCRRWGNPCGGRSRTAETRVQRAHVRVARDLGQDRRGHDRRFAGVALRPSRRPGRAGRGQALPSISACVRPIGRPCSDAPHAGQRRCRMLKRSISSASTNSMCQASARSTMSGYSASRSRSRKSLGVVESVDRPRRIEDDRRHDHRAGERAATGLVDAGDAQAHCAPQQLRHRLGRARRGIAAQRLVDGEEARLQRGDGIGVAEPVQQRGGEVLRRAVVLHQFRHQRLRRPARSAG